jgi:dimethylamine monooxygenase subunit A
VLLDPLAALGRHPEGPQLAQGLKSQLQQLDLAQLAYKGLVESRDLLVEALGRYETAPA